MIRRSIVLVMVVAVVLSGAPAFASDDLGPYLEEQADAEFSAEQTVVCFTPDGVVSELSYVRQAGGVRVVEDADGALGVTRVSHGEDWTLDAHYTVEIVGRERFLSRPVTAVEVIDDETVRVSLLFDHSTGALLSSDVFNGDGTTYCSSRYLSFDAGSPTISSDLLVGLATSPEPGTRGEVDPDAFPDEIAGFRLAGISEGPAKGVTNGYYADGLFSFTLFVSDRTIEVPELADAPVVEMARGEYQRRFYPGQVILAWQTKSGGIVLIGDLPLDIQEEVLEALPAPGKPNFFVRFWRGLFG